MNKNHVIAALATVIFIDEVIIQNINKRKFARIKRAYLAAENKAEYFAGKLDENGIALTDFDTVVVKSYYEHV